MEVNLNADLGEEMGNDSAMLSIISSANIACGFHAGNETVMDQTIKSAIKNKVSIGAHPSFKDKEGFGRREIPHTNKEIEFIVTKQLETLERIAQQNKVTVTHVKPHGALNNMASKDEGMALSIAKATKEFNKEIIFLATAGSKLTAASKKTGIKVAEEIFADRNYDDNGNLISRKNKNALITNPEIATERIIRMLDNKSIYSVNGKKIPCEINSICIHGDTKNSILIAKKIRTKLIESNFSIKQLPELRIFQ